MKHFLGFLNFILIECHIDHIPALSVLACVCVGKLLCQLSFVSWWCIERIYSGLFRLNWINVVCKNVKIISDTELAYLQTGSDKWIKVKWSSVHVFKWHNLWNDFQWWRKWIKIYTRWSFTWSHIIFLSFMLHKRLISLCIGMKYLVSYTTFQFSFLFTYWMTSQCLTYLFTHWHSHSVSIIIIINLMLRCYERHTQSTFQMPLKSTVVVVSLCVVWIPSSFIQQEEEL